MHSPFIFHLVTEVLPEGDSYYSFESIENQRYRAFKDDSMINITDFGAGSLVSGSKKRSVAAIARTASLSPHFCRILFRLTNELQPRTIIELGTSLGFTTAYLASACKQATVFTLEGCPEIAARAGDLFRRLELSNVQVRIGEFEKSLPGVLQEIPTIGLVFIDGNHRYEPTISYFNRLLQKCDEHSVLIFDDIHWSPGMAKAWNEISAHPKVTLSVDLFRIGLVFFRTGSPKQHFVLRNRS